MSKPAFTVRASSWDDLFDCGLRWYYRNVEGIRRPASAEAYLGTAVHKSTAAFDRAKIEGSPITPDDAADVLVQAIKRPEDDVEWRPDKTARDAEKIGLALHTRYCMKIAPQFDYRSVETILNPLEVETEDAVIKLTGTLDRRYAEVESESPEGQHMGFAEEFGVADVKTGGRAVNADGAVNVRAKGAQGGVYELLAERHFGVKVTKPYKIAALSTSGKGAVGVASIPNARSILIGRDDKPGLIELAAKMMKAGVFPPNPRSLLCSPKYCPAWDFCIYHE